MPGLVRIDDLGIGMGIVMGNVATYFRGISGLFSVKTIAVTFLLLIGQWTVAPALFADNSTNTEPPFTDFYTPNEIKAYGACNYFQNVVYALPSYPRYGRACYDTVCMNPPDCDIQAVVMQWVQCGTDLNGPNCNRPSLDAPGSAHGAKYSFVVFPVYGCPSGEVFQGPSPGSCRSIPQCAQDNTIAPVNSAIVSIKDPNGTNYLAHSGLESNFAGALTTFLNVNPGTCGTATASIDSATSTISWSWTGTCPSGSATYKKAPTCTSGYTLISNQCVPQTCPTGGGGPGGTTTPEAKRPQKNNGPPKACNDEGNPCNSATGNKYQSETDFTSPGTGLNFTRSYNSLSQQDGTLGFGWTGPNDKRLELYNNGDLIQVREATGRGYPYQKQTDGTWLGDGDTTPTLTQDASGYTLTFRDGSSETYDTSGKLLTIKDANNKTTTYVYDSNGRVSTITGPFGHVLSFTYNASGKLTQVTDPSAQQYAYIYDANNNLTKVTYPDGSARHYHYENTSFIHHLTGISNDTGSVVTRFSTYAFDANGKAITSEHAGGQGKVTLNYTSSTQTIVTDAANNTETLTFAENLGVKNLLSRMNSDSKGINQTFDANNNRTCVKDAEGKVTTSTYNTANQMTNQTVGQTGDCTAPQSTSTTRTTTYTYVSNSIDLPTAITRPSVATGKNQTTTITYDANHNPTGITQAGFKPNGTAVTARSVTIAYNSLGQVTSINGPRTDVTDITSFSYYSCTTGTQCGQLNTITNAKGHITTFNSYDVNGRVTEQTDANGTKTLYSYDLKGRLIGVTTQVGGSTTRQSSFTYTAFDAINTATLPNGLILTYQYNAAQELTQVSDSLGNKVTYTYDSRGNRTQTDTKNPDDTLVRTISLSYDIRSRVNSINTAGSITTLVNDAIGNLSQTTDPNQQGQGTPKKTAHTYDALNRITQTVDVLAGNTGYQYNTHNQLTQVTAPNSTTTTYTLDDLNNRLSETSPDRGAIAYTFNPAGQVISITDARNITVSYQYDALGRITNADYPGSSEDITYTYDTCPNGKTRLCATTDQSGSTTYEFDAAGNITQVTRAINSVNYVTQYAYDNRDQITTITYPDGRSVTYSRDSLSRITQVTSTLNGVVTTLLSNRSYRADGLPTAQTFGNGVAETRSYDLQGRLTQTTGVGPGVTYSYDANSNVTQIQNGAHNPVYAFDAKDRVTGDASVLAQIAYSYDTNANRSSITKDGNVKAYTYTPNSNQLIQVKNKAYTLDAAGNTTSINNGKWTYTYNNQGRLSTVSKQGQLKGTYTYNARGQRIIKTVKDKTTVYLYDLQGNLINEYKDNKLKKAYIWANTTPIAQIGTKIKKKTGATEDKEIYYLHTDHLNTPRQATDATKTVVWIWNSDAFGKQKPNPDPDLDTTKVRINLRFPGQYYDKESKLFYNWNRYYSPKLGRYITSDPIGLEGGLNTYGYVDANPLKWIDPFGLTDPNIKLASDLIKILEKPYARAGPVASAGILGYMGGTLINYGITYGLTKMYGTPTTLGTFLYNYLNPEPLSCK